MNNTQNNFQELFQHYQFANGSLLLCLSTPFEPKVMNEKFDMFVNKLIEKQIIGELSYYQLNSVDHEETRSFNIKNEHTGNSHDNLTIKICGDIIVKIIFQGAFSDTLQEKLEAFFSQHAICQSSYKLPYSGTKSTNHEFTPIRPRLLGFINL